MNGGQDKMQVSQCISGSIFHTVFIFSKYLQQNHQCDSIFPSGSLRNIGRSSLISDPPALALNQGLQDLWDEGRKRHMSYFQHVQSWTCNTIMATHLLMLLHLSVLHRSCSKNLASQQLQEDYLIDHPPSHQSANRFGASWFFLLPLRI